MTSRDFCYWLQGFFELTTAGPLDFAQAAVIKNHLALVFKHEIDPNIDKGDPAKKAELDLTYSPPQIGGTGPGGVVYRC